MNTYRLGRLATISLASLLFAGCDDATPSDSNGNSGGSSGGESGSASDDESSSASATQGTASNSGTTTGDSAGGDSSSTGSPDTDSAGASSTSTGFDESSTGGGDSDSTSDGAESSSTGDSNDDDGAEDGGKVEVCEAPGDLTPCDAIGDDPTPFQAMGLGCDGGPNEAIPILNAVFQSNDATAWRVISQYGSYIDPGDGLPIWRPREGESMLIASTGTMPPANAAGVLIETTDGNDNTSNPDFSPLPAPMSPLEGSAGGAGGTPFVNCDDVNDCSDSLNEQWNLGGGNARDLLWFQFETVVPGGTYGFSFDFAYFSEEFPTFVDTTYNDMFVAWSDSESYTGNLCFVNDEPCTVTALAFDDDYPEHDAFDPVLEGTQFASTGAFDTGGGATGWFQANGTTVPGELLQLTFAVFDMGDSSLDTAVLLDNFRWDCEGCTPSEVDPCIGIDPV